MTERPTAAELLRTEGALLTRSHLRELGLERRAVDAVFRECPVVQLPGYSRPLVRVSDYLALIEGSTYCDRCGDRVRPTRGERGLDFPRRSSEAPGGGRRNGRPPD
jgi:hypothetical protein